MKRLTSIEIAALLQEITPDEPCGVNLEYDPAFVLLEQILQGKPEVEYGKSVIDAAPPEWEKVAALAWDLMTRSRDLRIAIVIARAELNFSGIHGFTAGLALIESLLEQRWDNVHPQLDATDNNDPMVRINTLSSLIGFDTVLRDFKEAVLFESQAHGSFCLRDIDIASGTLQVESDEKTAMAIIDGAFMDMEFPDAYNLCKVLEQAFLSIVHIEEILTKRVGVSQALDFSALSTLLKRAHDFVCERMARHPNKQIKAQFEPTIGNKTTSNNTGVQQNAQLMLEKQFASSDITDSGDVVRALEKICAYYNKNEPSSPIPFLLKRTQLLINKNFVDILQDVASDGMNQFLYLSGTKSE